MCSSDLSTQLANDPLPQIQDDELPPIACGADIRNKLGLNLPNPLEPSCFSKTKYSSYVFVILLNSDIALNHKEISVYSVDGSGAPNYYLAKKVRRAISATREQAVVEVGAVKKFLKYKLANTRIIGIESIVDSNGNTWYEVPYLAQDIIFERVANTAFNDPDAAVYSEETPYLLKLKKVPRRFVTRVLEDGLEIQFVAGIVTGKQ